MKSRTAEARLRVLHPITAEATQISSSEDFPLIPATSRMIELMEMAAARLMKPRLQDHESSVAVAMNITYAAPQLRRPNAGCTLRAVASYKEIAGKLHRFTINAFDESGLIGTAEHTRAVLIERRLTDVAREQAGKHGVRLIA
jgi:fluoroacetyl-CoA thioesterase